MDHLGLLLDFISKLAIYIYIYIYIYICIYLYIYSSVEVRIYCLFVDRLGLLFNLISKLARSDDRQGQRRRRRDGPPDARRHQFCAFALLYKICQVNTPTQQTHPHRYSVNALTSACYCYYQYGMVYAMSRP